ncbi:peptidase [Aureimonas glaciei]|uniref:Peptidase n=2 Tax=Aureimonas glaciei TaxID=1776957 RepID=A0A917DFT4_9HYPH|nr:peptidase [Aureimonas glaciei]
MGQCRSLFGGIAFFSFAINLLMLASPIYMLQVYDRVLVTGRVETLLLLTGMTVAAMLLMGALDALRSVVMVRMGCWLNSRLGPVLLSNSVSTRLAGDGSGAQPLRDLATLQGFISSQGLTVFFDAPWTPLFLALIWFLHPVLGMFAVGSAIVLLILSVANELMTRTASENASTAQIRANQQAEATIRNAEVVRAMGMMPRLAERWMTTNEAALAAIRRSSEIGAFVTGLSKFIRIFVQSATLGLGAYLVLRGEVSGGAMIASSILLGRALAPVEAAMSTWRNFGTARIAFYRLKARMQAVPPETRRTRLPDPYGVLEMRQVGFTPPGSRSSVLQGITLRLVPGEAVAAIGPSASGKSTLCKLLTGILSPSQGEVRLDGSELQHWDADQLGSHIGYLPQDVELFSGSVRENIARMKDADDEAIVAAAKLAHAHEMIQKLPQGYETQIGDSGTRLSGGQRQRIGLARAVFGDPRVIILDEPNANLDQVGEAALAAAVAELKSQRRTIIIVGHRPSTLAQADKVLLLRDGRIEMFGPREEVLKRLRDAATEVAKAAAMPNVADGPQLGKAPPTVESANDERGAAI